MKIIATVPMKVEMEVSEIKDPRILARLLWDYRYNYPVLQEIAFNPATTPEIQDAIVWDLQFTDKVGGLEALGRIIQSGKYLAPKTRKALMATPDLTRMFVQRADVTGEELASIARKYNVYPGILELVIDHLFVSTETLRKLEKKFDSARFKLAVIEGCFPQEK